MDRQQKIKVLELISQGKTPQQAIKLAEMPQCMFFRVDQEQEIEELRQSGYEGKIYTLLILDSGRPIANSEDEAEHYLSLENREP